MPVGSFLGTLKRELPYQRGYVTRPEARQDIFEYIKDYNWQRRHSTLGYTPAEDEARAAVAYRSAYGVGRRSM